MANNKKGILIFGIIAIIVIVVFILPKSNTQSIGTQAISSSLIDASIAKSTIYTTDNLQINYNLKETTTLGGDIVEFCVDCYNPSQSLYTQNFGPGSNCDNLLGTVDAYPPSNPQRTALAENALVSLDPGICSIFSCETSGKVTFENGLSAGTHNVYATVYKVPISLCTSKTDCFTKACQNARDGKAQLLLTGQKVGTITVLDESTPTTKPGTGTTTPTTPVTLPDGTKLIATQLSLTQQDLSQVTDPTIMQATCAYDGNCLPYTDLQGNSNYTVKCRSTGVTKSRVDSAAKNNCDSGVLSYINFQTVGGGVVAACAIGAVGLAPFTVGASTLIIPAGCIGALGTGVALGGVKAALASGCYIHSKNAAQGLCIATSSTGNFFSSFALFNITGDPNTDGMIIIFGAAMLLIILLTQRR